ncbi:acyltransferase family protein [Cryptosporangium phraense]|uniref:acyltransferase family protein n=1 Tax=Cryptosporangium phraense TaxID=2593070 RepID=UPI0014797DF0|nr:acyltransferase [Cryptosporangium phraense]
MRATTGQLRRCHELDVLRFLAAAAVVAFHWMFRSTTGSTPLATTGFEGHAALFRYGYLGVDVFFVISGFVILRSAWGRTAGTFLLNRAGRLYPAFWVACTVTALAVTLLPGDRLSVSFGQWAANLTMGSEAFGVTYVDGVYWTLLVELAFYGLVAVGTVVGLTVNRVLAGAGLWLGISLVHSFWSMSDGWARLFVPEWTPYFTAGVGFALLAKEGPGASLSRRQRWVALGITLASCGWALVRGVSFANALTRKYGLPFSGWVVCAVLLTTFVAFALLVGGVRVPGAARIAFLGALTYPLYLLHENIGYTLLTIGNVRLGLNRWFVLVFVGLVVVGLAWALNRYVEEPGSRRMSRALKERSRQHTRSAPRTVDTEARALAAYSGLTPVGRAL